MNTYIWHYNKDILLITMAESLLAARIKLSLNRSVPPNCLELIWHETPSDDIPNPCTVIFNGKNVITGA